MAEPTPGQVIPPGGAPEEPPKAPDASQQEVSVDLSRPQILPNDQTPPPAPTPPSLPPQSAPTPPVSPPQEVVPSPQPPVAPLQPPSAAAPPSPDAGGLAPQFQVTTLPAEDQTSNQLEAEEVISWTASEYIAHQKSGGWYGALAGCTILFSVLVYFLTSGDVISVVVIFFAAIVFGIYAGKKPKEQQYAISPEGIAIGPKIYEFSQLKTFSITDDGAFSSITFWPMKRFMPTLSIYYDPQDEERIVNTLSLYLPLDTEKRDAVESLMRKIRF